MYRSDRTPGLWQHPTPQQTFPDTGSGKPSQDYLRQRLQSEPPEKNDSSEPATLGVAAAFFGRLTKLNQGAKTDTKIQHPTPLTTSSSRIAEDLSLVEKLKYEYSMYAAELHGATVNRLAEVHSKLEAAVSATKKQDEAFIAAVTGHKNIVRSLNASRTQYECIDEKTGRKTTQVASIGDCIKSSADRLTALETEVQHLWAQWDDAQNEISSILEEVTSKGIKSSRRQDGDANESVTVASAVHAEFSNDFKVLERDWEYMAQGFFRQAKATENNAKTAGCGAIAGLVQQKLLDD